MQGIGCNRILAQHFKRNQDKDKTLKVMDMERAVATIYPRELQKLVYSKQSVDDAPAYVKNYYKCLHQFNITRDLCAKTLSGNCRKASIKAAKLMRLNMDVLEPFLLKHLKAKVLYYIRDPRGIMMSRMLTKKYEAISDDDILLEARMLCQKMEFDFERAKLLSMHFPGRIKLIKYEDVANNQMYVAKDVYHFLGLDLPAEVFNWVSESTTKKKNVPQLGTETPEATTQKAAEKAWRQRFLELKPRIGVECKAVLTKFGHL